MVERLMSRYDAERPVLPYRKQITNQEREAVAQQHGISPDDPALCDLLSEWCGAVCSQDEQGYFYWSSDNPHGHWDGWIVHDLHAVLTPDGVWHELPYRWDETARHVAQRKHLAHQIVAQYPAHIAVLVDCHR
jgi:hypothetical protein